MNFDLITSLFLSVFPNGAELVKLIGSVGHAITAMFLLYLCLLMFTLLIRATVPCDTTRQLRTQTKMALSLMQAISGVAFSLQVGYLVMKEPWLSFTMFMGFTYILAINAVFFLGIRFLFPNRMKDVLLQNKIASGVEIGLLHLAWAIVTLGSMASRY